VAWRDWVRTVEVEPSLYAADFSRLGDQLTHLLNAGSRILHFDIGDGHFVEPVTIGPVVLKSIAPLVHEAGGFLDCHLMVDNPERHIPQVAKAGGDSVTFHVEACDDVPALLALAREEAVEAAADADLALCMSIHPGYSGQEFMPEALGRLRQLRDQLPGDVFVQVDGGITHDNVRAAHEAGADLLVAGSAIFDREDRVRAYHRLVQALA
jgi:ribulose-phosphate 3-epimerase